MYICPINFNIVLVLHITATFVCSSSFNKYKESFHFLVDFIHGFAHCISCVLWDYFGVAAVCCDYVWENLSLICEGFWVVLLYLVSKHAFLSNLSLIMYLLKYFIPPLLLFLLCGMYVSCEVSPTRSWKKCFFLLSPKHHASCPKSPWFSSTVPEDGTRF